jgi:hypothetical protein
VITLLVVVLIVGVIVWFVQQYVPMTPPFKMGFTLLALLVLLIYALNALGLMSVPLK